MLEASGAAIDRWRGYRTPESWLRTFEQALSDLSPFEDKEKRFKAAPTETLAAALGRIHGAMGHRKESVGCYRQAERLAGAPKPEYSFAIFMQQMGGLGDSEFALQELRASADAVMAGSGGDPFDRLVVADALADLARERKDASLLAPYLGPALAASEPLSDDHAKRLRSNLRIAEALLIKGDKDLAVSLKRESLPAGWEGDAGKLNDFAWWCFQSEVNLEEAERLARKGVELAKSGAEKAEILDTAAEICNLLGDCDDAVSLSEQASREDSTNEHYARQVKRFAELRDRKKTPAGV